MVAGGTAIAAQGSSSPRAPSAHALAVVPPMRVIAAASGPSDVDSALPGRYQYVILGAASTQTVRALLRREVRFLLAHGWARAQATVLITNTRTGTVRIQVVPVGTPGSDVQLDNPRHHIYAAIEMVATNGAAPDITDGTPLPTAPIARAIQRHDRLLNVVLGNGFHQEAHNGEIFASGY
jgi:hypothetical protein